jgi:hypothetical protein
MDAAFAARFPLEMLDGVSYINFFAVDTGFDQRVIEQLACGTDERFSDKIFLVAGLLAHQHELAVRCAFTENGLRAEFP